jgi:hypothetical protein
MMPRPRISDDTDGMIEDLIDDLETSIQKNDIKTSRFLGKKGHVTYNAVIREGVKALINEYDKGDLEL